MVELPVRPGGGNPGGVHFLSRRSPGRAQLPAVTAVGLLTDLVELGVGAACLAAAPLAWRRMRWLGVVLVVAGLAAVAHAFISIAA